MLAYTPVYTGHGYTIQEIDTKTARSIPPIFGSFIYNGYCYNNQLFINESDAWKNIRKQYAKSYKLEDLRDV